MTDVIGQTNEKNISRLETGAMILICAIFMMQMSERVWKICMSGGWRISGDLAQKRKVIENSCTGVG